MPNLELNLCIIKFAKFDKSVELINPVKLSLPFLKKKKNTRKTRRTKKKQILPFSLLAFKEINYWVLNSCHVDAVPNILILQY